MNRSGAGFVVAGAVLMAFLLLVDAPTVWRQVAGVDILPFALGFPLVFLALICWSEAYRWLFRAADADLPPGRAFTAYGTGMFTKQVLPLGHVGGPAIVAYAYDRAVPLDYDESIAVVTVGEAVTLVGSVSLALVGVAKLFTGTQAVAERRLLAAAAVLAAGALLTLLYVIHYRRRAVGLAVHGLARLCRLTLGRLSARVAHATAPQRVGGALVRYYHTLDTVAGDRRALSIATGFVLLGWICFAVPLYAAAVAIGVTFPLVAALFLVPASGIATMVPLPGGLGGYEVVLTGAIVALVGAEAAAAAAVVLLYRLCSYWFLLLVGGLATAHASTATRTPEPP